jgi:hypothetical protein
MKGYNATTRPVIVEAMERHGSPMSYAEMVKATGLSYRAVAGSIQHWRKTDRKTAPRIAEWSGIVVFFELSSRPDAIQPKAKTQREVWSDWYRRNRANSRARCAALKTGKPLDSWAAGLLMLADVQSASGKGTRA